MELPLSITWRAGLRDLSNMARSYWSARSSQISRALYRQYRLQRGAGLQKGFLPVSLLKITPPSCKI